MITIIMEASDIPEGTTVRKPTGQKQYLMRRDGLTVYSNDYGHKFTQRDEGVTVYGAGKLHMTCAEHIVLLGSGRGNRLAIDFEDIEDAAGFLAELAEAE